MTSVCSSPKGVVWGRSEQKGFFTVPCRACSVVMCWGHSNGAKSVVRAAISCQTEHRARISLRDEAGGFLALGR